MRPKLSQTLREFKKRKRHEVLLALLALEILTEGRDDLPPECGPAIEAAFNNIKAVNRRCARWWAKA